MRVISGRFKGRHLTSFRAEHIRPTTDRVKESLFNKIQGRVDGATVLDLFAGTGSLGIEAISRGAEEVLFVDDHPKSLSILKKNLTLLKVEQGYGIERSDVIKFLRNYKGRAFDLIFIDPPFTEKMAHSVLTALSESTVGHDATWVAIETVKGELVEGAYGPWLEFDCKDFSDKALRWFSKEGR